MKVKIVEVSPRDGLQSLKEFIPTKKKRELISSLYSAGFEEVEEISFANPRILPQMADAEKVFTKGSALVMNKKGYERAKEIGVKKINIVFSPCEEFNLKNMGKTRSEIVLMYKTFMDKVPKENVRVYLSMAFGSPYSGDFSTKTIKSCVRDAKMFGDTVVFCDTVGVGIRQDVKMFAEICRNLEIKPALHLHHRGREEPALSLVKIALFEGINEFDTSLSGLGGCPFAEESGENLSTETLITHLEAWGFDCGISIEALKKSTKISAEIQKIALKNRSRETAC
jgi:hydroxymethylglutaryl-CoA lyase